MVTVVGELRFKQAGRPRTARLLADMRWACDDKQFEVFLNQTCPIEPAPRDIDEHRAVVHCLYQTAERLGAEVQIPTR